MCDNVGKCGILDSNNQSEIELRQELIFACDRCGYKIMRIDGPLSTPHEFIHYPCPYCGWKHTVVIAEDAEYALRRTEQLLQAYGTGNEESSRERWQEEPLSGYLQE